MAPADAEGASHGATVLSGNAERDAPRRRLSLAQVFGLFGHRNQHALDARSTLEFEQKLARAIGRREDADETRRIANPHPPEPVPERASEVAHQGRIGHPAAVEPAKHLARTEAGFAALGERRGPILEPPAERMGTEVSLHASPLPNRHRAH